MSRGFVFSYQRELSITAQDFLDILYWFEEEEHYGQRGKSIFY